MFQKIGDNFSFHRNLDALLLESSQITMIARMSEKKRIKWKNFGKQSAQHFKEPISNVFSMIWTKIAERMFFDGGERKKKKKNISKIYNITTCVQTAVAKSCLCVVSHSHSWKIYL